MQESDVDAYLRGFLDLYAQERPEKTPSCPSSRDLVALAGGDIDPARRSGFLAHARECPACLREYTGYYDLLNPPPGQVVDDRLYEKVERMLSVLIEVGPENVKDIRQDLGRVPEAYNIRPTFSTEILLQEQTRVTQTRSVE